MMAFINTFWLENKGEVPVGVTMLRGSISGVFEQFRSDREWKVRESEQIVTVAEVNYIKNPLNEAIE